MLSDPDARANGGQLASAISNRVVRVISEYTGRGPTMARAYLHDDLISVVVRDSLSKGERSLVADGKTEVVLGMRRHYQKAMRRDLVGAVEELTGREVIAFFSANHVEPDAALESFLLAPRADSDGSVDALGAAEA
ncbi:MAG: Na-translocating system protein MpsC family protein [Solirubrobacteraceae bacterium]